MMAPITRSNAIPGLSLTWRQLTGIAGILGVLMFVIGVVLMGDTPTVDDSVADVRAWYADNGQRQLWGDFVITIGVLFFLVPFACGLRHRLVEAEGGAGGWGMIAFVSLLFWMLLGGAASIATGALGLGIDKIEGDGAVRTLQYMDLAGFGGNSIILVPFFVALAFAIIQTKVFWSWLAWLSLVLAVVSFAGSLLFVDGDPTGPFATLGLISTLGFGVTTLLISVAMLKDGANSHST